jgi:hypothetical protein
MPFTVSHAAAVLPLKNSRLPLAALMVGSMSPDFAYFLPAALSSRTASHSLPGIFLFCLPAGLCVWQLFVRVLERPTIELLPEPWRTRVPRSDPGLSLRALILAVIAVLVGAATHVAWDAFTHANTPITNAFPVFRAEVLEVGDRSIRLYFVLQVLSSVAGLLALASWALNLRQRAPRIHAPGELRSALSSRARAAAVAMVIMTAGFTALMNYANYSDLRFEHRIFQMLIGGMTGWLLSWVVVAMWVSRSVPRARAG